MIFDQAFQFFLVHDRDHFLGHLVHVSITALKLERGFRSILVVFGGAVDILLIHHEDRSLNHAHLFQNIDDFIGLRSGVAVFHLRQGNGRSFGDLDEFVEVVLLSGGQRGQGRIAGERVLNIGHFEHLLLS